MTFAETARQVAYNGAARTIAALAIEYGFDLREKRLSADGGGTFADALLDTCLHKKNAAETAKAAENCIELLRMCPRLIVGADVSAIADYYVKLDPALSSVADAIKKAAVGPVRLDRLGQRII